MNLRPSLQLPATPRPASPPRHSRPPAPRLLLLSAGLLAAALFAALSGCSRAGGAAGGGVAQITVAGSTSVTPFAERLGEEFMRSHPGREVNIQGIGSSAGIQATETGAADIGMASRELKSDEEEKLRPVCIALDALAIIVHPSNPVHNLTLSQVRDVFAGKITRWNEVGGEDAPITLVNREAGSGTRGAFEELVMGKEGPPLSFDALRQGSNGAVRAVIEEDPHAIGYISLGIVSPQVRAVQVDGVEPSQETIRAGRYTLVRPFLFVLRKGEEPSELGKEYITYVLSDEGQQELVRAGLIGTPERELPWKS